MDTQLLTTWPRAEERDPFDPKRWNLLARVNNGDRPARIRWQSSADTPLINTFPELNYVSVGAEFDVQNFSNINDPGTRYAIRAGAAAGAQVAGTDAAILLANSSGGTGFRFKNGLLFGASPSQAIDASIGTMIGSEAITVQNGINLSSVTFQTSGRIENYPGIAGRIGWQLQPINGSAGLRTLLDLSNDTITSRHFFRSGNADGATTPALGVLPNGSKIGFAAYNSSDPGNAGYLFLGPGTTDGFQDIQSARTGGGGTLPLRFLIDSTSVFKVRPSELAISLENTRWLAGRNTADSTSINIARVNNANRVEIGVAGQAINFQGWMQNGVPLYWMNAAGSAGIPLLNLTSSNIMEIGAPALRMSFLGGLTNNIPFNGRNNANSANLQIAKITTADQVEIGGAGVQTNLVGFTVGQNLNLPDRDGLVTRYSQCKAYGSFGWTGAAIFVGDSYNCALVTRSALGQYTFWYSRFMAGTAYAPVVTAYAGTMCVGMVVGIFTNACSMLFTNLAGVAMDPSLVFFVAFGNLA